MVVLQVLKLVTCIRKETPGRQTQESSAWETLFLPPDPHDPVLRVGAVISEQEAWGRGKVIPS